MYIYQNQILEISVMTEYVHGLTQWIKMQMGFVP